MKRALLTYGVGPHAELLEIALPSYRAFADLHDYELVIAEIESARPPSWWKIPALKEALQTFDEVLFLGADLVIVDDSEDLPVPRGYWQALVAHQTAEGEVPNADMWLVRRPMLPYLDRIWALSEYLNHPWWEQAALLQLMGYRPAPMRCVEPNDLTRRTCFLDSGWNVHRNDAVRSERPRIMHATMWPDRAAVMREWAAQAAA